MPQKRLIYFLTKIFLKTIGRLSAGIRICYDEGLTSGKMLDYIYKNQPQGQLGIGKMIDRAFLNHPGWEAIRIRRKNLEELLKETINQLRKKRKPIALVDIASGPAGYILSVLKEIGAEDILARCRDLDERWLKEGEEEKAHQKLKNVYFEKGDALDEKSLLKLLPRPNIIISSGFYDWITSDRMVQDSIRIVFNILEPEGFFITTNQTGHPNLEFAQAVFLDFAHEPLKMTMRPESLMQSWLRETGFVIERTLIDANKYFAVTMARKTK